MANVLKTFGLKNSRKCIKFIISDIYGTYRSIRYLFYERNPQLIVHTFSGYFRDNYVNKDFISMGSSYM
jgi:hypothetical protein